MSIIVSGFILGIFVGYLHSLSPTRRMFCSSCTEDKKRERYVNKRIVLKSVVLSDDDDSSTTTQDEETNLVNKDLSTGKERDHDDAEIHIEAADGKKNSTDHKKKNSKGGTGTKKTKRKSSTRSICPRKHALLDSSSTCAICWNNFQEGETACLSSNKRCNHAFHFDCILPWLLKRNDCPLCRRNFLKG